MSRRAVLLVAMVLLFNGASFAQDQRSEVSVQGTGFFTKDSDGRGLVQRGTQTGGVLAGFRYHFSRWFAAEANYGYARDTQKYFSSGTSTRIQVNFHEVTGAFVVTAPAFRDKIHAFALAGGGLVFDPTGNAGGRFAGATTETKGAFLYGGGVDYDLLKRVALRVEYRGLVYKAPNFNVGRLDIDQFTHVAQPSASLVFRF